MTVDEDRAEAERFWSAPLNERCYAMVYDRLGRLWMRCPKHGANGGTCWRLCTEVDADFEGLQWYREGVQSGATEEAWNALEEEENEEDEEPEKTGGQKSFYGMVTWEDYINAGVAKAKKKMNKIKDETPGTAPWLLCPCPGCKWEATRGATWEDACTSCKVHTGGAVTNEKKDYKAGEFWKIMHPGVDWMAQALPDDEWDWKPNDHLEELVKAGVITEKQAADTAEDGDYEEEDDHTAGKKGSGKKGGHKGKHHAEEDDSGYKGSHGTKGWKKGGYNEGKHYAVADAGDDKDGKGSHDKGFKSGGNRPKKGKSASSAAYGPKPPRHGPYWRW